MAEASAITTIWKLGLPEHVSHKNRLQEYTQRSAIPLPVYQTLNEGSSHAPRFRATVLVDGVSYVSSETFSHRKEAEQSVAKYALERILEKIKSEGCPLLGEDTTFCKSILNEYALKMNIEKSSYETIQSKGLLPTFFSSLSFNGKLYTGSAGRNKKEAEQLAARAVIQSILGEPNSGTCLPEIIKSKGKLYAAVHNIKDSGTSTSIRREVGVLPGTDEFPMPANARTCQGQQGAVPVPNSEPHGREIKKPKWELVSETTTGGSVTSFPVPQADQSHPNQVHNELPFEQPYAGIVSGSSQGAVVVQNEVSLSQPSAVGGSSQGTVATTVAVKHSHQKNKRRAE
ncbi:double-stranded RNA-binding protein 4-like [Macadamia integrifolia]|uniref:double-stranded RNA-binding protein 4-like n=1 Tax=Macadamia integrifolia TaxID=60698 RepID=UPI001C4E5E60|nr:double-stranded RNA-binding protein 4-like [Macadamia integrifolia]